MQCGQVSTQQRWFIDTATGRKLLLRGVNLGGSSKLPVGTTSRDPISLQQTISFVGRPFPLDECDEHFKRLRHWGFNCLRFLVTWEAIEPHKPRKYDTAYLDYVYQVIKKAGEYGFYVFLDPHQDAWSRASGGDGAPLWTLQLVGFDLESHDGLALDESEAAITHAGRLRMGTGEYECMVWPNNWYRLASSTMFTLFFAGDRFAPLCRVVDDKLVFVEPNDQTGESIQTYLQRHFISAMQQVALRVKSLPNVIGYDSLNEPTAGYIGNKSLSLPQEVYRSSAQLTAFESMYIPSGISKSVPFIRRHGVHQSVDGSVVLNPKKVNCWVSPERDIWKRHGVWEIRTDSETGDTQPVLLRDDYFAGVSFFDDCLMPFVAKYARALSAVHPASLFFVEGEPGKENMSWPESLSDIKIVNASHWYDLLTLTTKHYDPENCLVWGDSSYVTGREQVRQSFIDQFAVHVKHSREALGDVPTIIGEFGMHFDLDGGKAYKDGDYSQHNAALSAYYDALDANLLSSAHWNYTADNNNQFGDNWNDEDLSIFSRDQQHSSEDDLNSGARGLLGFCRPTMRDCAANATPVSQRFCMESGDFSLELEVESGINTQNVLATVFVPRIQYPSGFSVNIVSADSYASEHHYNAESQVLKWFLRPQSSDQAQLSKCTVKIALVRNGE